MVGWLRNQMSIRMTYEEWERRQAEHVDFVDTIMQNLRSHGLYNMANIHLSAGLGISLIGQLMEPVRVYKGMGEAELLEEHILIPIRRHTEDELERRLLLAKVLTETIMILSGHHQLDYQIRNVTHEPA